jgi:pilus assembly protein CpaB
MKWSILGLMFLGVVAALSAAVLVGSLRGRGVRDAVGLGPQVKEVEVVVAATAMPAMTVVDGKSVTTTKVPEEAAPVNHFGHSVNVVGQLLVVPVVEGQVLTRSCFAMGSTGAQLAATLSKGMRAMTLQLDASRVPPAYPGSIVDVLVSFTLPSDAGGRRGDAISMTLLQGIEVLAVDDRTVVSEVDEEGGEQSRGRISAPRDRLVTLMVDTDQAKALQLALKYGTVSLSLRNPLDDSPVETDTTLLSQLSDEYSDLLAQLAASQAPQPAGLESESAPRAGGEFADNSSVTGPRPVRVGASEGGQPARRPPAAKSLWKTDVLRAGQLETESFPLPEEPA